MHQKNITVTANSSSTFAHLPSHTRTSIIDIAKFLAKKDARLHFEREATGNIK